MIPPDVASSLRSVLTESQNATQQPQQTQPVAATQRIADVLGNLVPGQRIMAEIQGMQANGTYRATVGQREITLSLPFSAKAGDSLELEVTEAEGKLTLAFVANRGETAAKDQPPVSVATSLSNTGRMIGDLLQELTVDGKRAPAAPLNGNQALVQSMPKEAAQLVPILKQALTQSGMFYEAHQARWAAGRLPTEQLRQEPQGRLPAPANPLPAGSNPAPTISSPPQSQPGAPPAATGFSAGAAASGGNPPSASTGTVTPPPSGSPAAPAPPTSVPIPTSLPAPTGDGTQPGAGGNPTNQALPPQAQGQAQPSPATLSPQALPTPATTPPEQASGAATSQQTATAAPSVPANAASAPAHTAAPSTPLQATPAQATPGMSPPAAALPPAPAASTTAPTQAPAPSQGAGAPENAQPTGAPPPPPGIRQGNLIYEAFPPRHAWLPQGSEAQAPVASPLASPAPPPPASPQREVSGQPGLSAPSHAEAAAIKAGPDGAARPAESNPDSARPPTVSTSAPAAGTEKAQQSPGLPPSPAGIPRDIAPLVQQQLDGLANQNYAWQGQIWPGQNLWWEIGEDPESRRGNDEEGQRWQTRLRLTLPVLGDVDARISLQGAGQISLRIAAGDAASATQLQERLAELRRQFENSGLSIGQMRVDHEPLPQTEPAA